MDAPFDQDSQKVTSTGFLPLTALRGEEIIQAVLTDRVGRRFSFMYDAAMRKLLTLQGHGLDYEPTDPLWQQVEHIVAEASQPVPQDGQSVTAQYYRPGIQRNARVQRYLGVAHSSGVNVFYAMDQNRTFAILCREGGIVTDRSPADVDAEIREQRSFGEQRRFVVVVEGTVNFLMRFQQFCIEADYMIFCAPEHELEEMNVEIVDKGWSGGDPIGTLDQFLASVQAAEDKEPESKAGDDVEQGVMIALVPPEDARKKLLIPDGEPLEQLHVTLAYLGKTSEIGLTQPKVDRLAEICRAAAKTFAPIDATVGGVGSFMTNPETGLAPFLGLVDAPGINELQIGLKRALKATETPAKDDHSFTPHITLAYVKDGESVPQAPFAEPVKFQFGEIMLAVGPKRGRWQFEGGQAGGAEVTIGAVASGEGATPPVSASAPPVPPMPGVPSFIQQPQPQQIAQPPMLADNGVAPQPAVPMQMPPGYSGPPVPRQHAGARSVARAQGYGAVTPAVGSMAGGLMGTGYQAPDEGLMGRPPGGGPNMGGPSPSDREFDSQLAMQASLAAAGRIDMPEVGTAAPSPIGVGSIVRDAAGYKGQVQGFQGTLAVVHFVDAGEALTVPLSELRPVEV